MSYQEIGKSGEANLMTESAKSTYANVIVDIPNLDTRTFSYLIPDEIRESIKIGLPVLVPFGNQGVVNAFVVGFSNYLPEGIKAKHIYEILDSEPVFDLEYLKFLEWTADYYCCNLPIVLETAIPNFFSKAKRVVSLKSTNNDFQKLDKNCEKLLAILTQKGEITVSYLQKQAKLPSSKFYEALRKLRKAEIVEVNNLIDVKINKPKTERMVRLVNKETDNKRYSAILELLGQSEVKVSEFLKIAKTTQATLNKIAKIGNIEIFDKEVYRNPLKIFKDDEKDEFFELNFDQSQAVEKLANAVENKDSEPYLLFGITGSGKTEVYFNIIKKVLDKGRNVIFLAPEIPIASQMARRIAKRFGMEEVAIWHSNLSEGERYDVWQRLRNNKIRIIVGARSAIFAPIKNLGLIVIDEEHESSYKQTSPTPRYNAKTLAFERAKRTESVVILGSATPEISTYYRAINTNHSLLMPERIGASELAKVVVVDMKQEFSRGNRSIFSAALKQALERNLESKKQSILLINRRGFSTNISCNICGYVAQCKKCSIPLILHKTNNTLRCHYCGYDQKALTLCPECGSNAIRYSGMGTQRVEEEVKREFPHARIARMDSDILSKKNAHIEIMDEFCKGEIDILIGTQMIAKGVDNPNVTLVGVLMADSAFNMPDFRATERGFQLLTQVAGRAGRGDFEGKVYFQSYTPDFFALQTAKQQDYTNFYHAEILSRYEYSYPPYSQIIRLIISSRNEVRAERFSQELAMRLNTLTESRGIQEKLEILGPAPCIIAKLKDESRFQIIIKNRLEDKGHFLITGFIKKIAVPEDIKFLIDVDPSDML